MNDDYRYIFLHDDTDRRALRHVNSIIGRTVIFVIVGDFALSVILMLVLDTFAGENPAHIAVPFACGGLFFICFAAAAIIANVKSKRILSYSFSKLGRSKEDELKRNLHNLYVASQRAGNIMFICMLCAGIITGVIVAAVVHAVAKEPTSLYMLMATSTGVSIFCFVVAAFAVWAIMFYVYRRKARPIENQLTLMSFERDGQV